MGQNFFNSLRWIFLVRYLRNALKRYLIKMSDLFNSLFFQTTKKAILLNFKQYSLNKILFYITHHMLTILLCLYVLMTENSEGFAQMLLLNEISTVTTGLRLADFIID